MIASGLQSPKKITLFGHFGSPNPGNEGTFATILWHLRSRYPEAKIRCVCTNPQAVAARDGIDAIAITTRDGRIWDSDVPLARRVPAAFTGLAGELSQYARAARELIGSDALIVPGTGVVTDAFGLHWWGPYSQLKWVLMAKLCRVKVLYISVGAGPIDRPLSKLIVRATLSLADYRSYRDEASRACVAAVGVRSEHDPVYPDLVFGMPQQLLARKHRTESSRKVVGLGLMVYTPRLSCARPRPGTYARYLRSLAELAAWLLERDYDIRLLLGDADTAVIDEFRRALQADAGHLPEHRVIARPIATVDDILSELSACDTVVATRFHNVLMAMLLAKPVIAISFHHKVYELMRQTGVSEYCHDIHEIDGEELIEQFEALEANRAAVKRAIARSVARARAQSDEQYDHLFGRPTTPAATPRERIERAYLALGERVWKRLPGRTRELAPVRAFGAHSHALLRRHGDRQMALGTSFQRNRPALELTRRLVESADRGDGVRIAVLGSSIGAEVYSIVWTLRCSRPGLDLSLQAVDVSPEVLEVGRRGVYSPAASAMVHSSIFDFLTESERAAMFDWDGEQGTIKPWLRKGISWRQGDAGDPLIVEDLGHQDLVVANNFLCHFYPADAERCLRNLARLVRPGGYLFVAGVDLDVRTRVALELGWEPISTLRDEVHDGDRLTRADWPWRTWGVEPLDRRRADWETRYTACFRP